LSIMNLPEYCIKNIAKGCVNLISAEIAPD
jgi:hypothetical protein